MICRECGTECSDTANFCRHCGTKLRTVCNCWMKKGPFNCGLKTCPDWLEFHKRFGFEFRDQEA
nr:MAG TPA: PROTEIN/RNA Complex, archaeal, ribosomal, 50S, protein.0A [Caudoviricetes sp.]